MSMYRPYSDTAFNNCYDFIMKSKAEKEVWELSTSLTFDDKEEMRWELDRISDLTTDIMNAEYDLCEMEIEAAHDAEVYDSIMNRNAFRKGRNRKAKQNGKRNADKAKRLHKVDRYHGKNYLKRNNLQELSVENAEFFHNKKAMDIAYDDGKWIYTGKDGNNFWSKVWYTRHKKNRNNRLDSAMKAREEEYITEF